MEFSFDLRDVLSDAVTCVSGGQLSRTANGPKSDERGVRLAAIINKMGAASAKAQGLRVAVTTYQKLIASTHTLYLMKDDGEKPALIGLLKVGRKKLFLTDPQGVLKEVEPLCVLDFYIHETRQRAGHGRKLFQTMLNMEGVRASDLAIDRPSTKFLAFLKKHYRLHSDVKQGNNFVVFSQFFHNANVSSHPGSMVETKTQHSSSQWSSLTGRSQPRPTPRNHSSLSSLTATHHTGYPFTSLSDNHHNYNWSPDTVLMRTKHIRQTPCDIITGAPLLTSRWKQQGEGKEGSGNAPLLTMREKGRHSKRHSRQGLSSRAVSTIPGGCHLAGSCSGLGLIRPGSTYSRHSLKPMHPSSHTLIQPDQNMINSSMEQGPDNCNHKLTF